VLRPPAGQELVVTVDTLIENVHFPVHTDAGSIGHKALAVNLSDLAAMGAQPAWVLLALTVPEPDEKWLQEFARGFFELASQYNVQLVGGDTTRGSLSVTVQAMGFVPVGGALGRGGARAGDTLYVTGSVGDAGLGLRRPSGLPRDQLDFLTARLNRPSPRIDEGLRLRDIASSAIDVSDGLTADLGHVLAASAVGAEIESEALPLCGAVKNYVQQTSDWSLPLQAGDDYELLFTVPPARMELLQRRFADSATSVTPIGMIVANPGLLVRTGSNERLFLQGTGYDHFGR
ncbi:MAG: thiamine-phosphate kinase, partial [Gammaproteobacteria bacterium]